MQSVSITSNYFFFFHLRYCGMSSKTKKSSPASTEGSAKKIKVPKALVVRPSPLDVPKSLKLVCNEDLLKALEISKKSIVYVNNCSGSSKGVLAEIVEDPSIHDINVIGVSSSLRKLGGFLLGDRLEIKKYWKFPSFAKSVDVIISSESGEIVTLKGKLSKSFSKFLDDVGLISPGLEFKDVTLLGDQDTKVKVNVSIIDIDRSLDISDQLSQLNIDESHDTDTTSPTFIYNNQTKIIEFHGDTAQARELVTAKYHDIPQAVKFDQVGGLSKQISLLRSTIELPLTSPRLFSDFGISPPRGVLLHGPPGTGKTMLLRCVADEVDVHVLTINGPSIVSKYLGETENAIRDIFDEARKFQPSIIFLDEIDSLAPNRNSDDSGETESRVVATLLTMMDGLGGDGRLVVVGATNRPNAIDPALRRPGRFDREVEIGIPDVGARFDILQKQFAKMNHSKYQLSKDDMYKVASKTHGYVGADLTALVREAIMIAIDKGLKQSILNIVLTADDLEASIPEIRPSAMREIFLEMPKVYWSDILGQEELKKKLVEVVQLPLEANETFLRLGIRAPKGVLLYGPPGCSKTLTAKALATESGLNFLAVKGPEIFNKYVGESEKTIREIFRKARAASPSIIFFDEIDAISGDRDEATTSTALHVLTSLLNEIDGVEELNGVVIVAATNKPTDIDPALLRPGRLDRHIYVGPPDYEARLQILRNGCKKFNLDPQDIDNLKTIADLSEGCSGAEVTLICQEAGLAAVMEDHDTHTVCRRHFDQALSGISKGIDEEMLNYYKEFSHRSGLNM